MMPNPVADHRASEIKPHLAVAGVLEPAMDEGWERWLHPTTNEFHRLDGPAVTCEEPGKLPFVTWYVNGHRHRVGGPAELRDGIETWYENGVPHRLDGPAVVSPPPPPGVQAPKHARQWWVNGYHLKHNDDAEQLDALHASGRLEELELVLRLWRENGPTVAELVDAVRAAAA